MGFDQYHEPADELPAQTRTFARLCASLTEEAEAISLAHQRNLHGAQSDNQKQQSSADAQKEISKHEALSFSIVYNNLLFFVLLIFFGFFIFANLSSAVNYVLTASVAASLVSISSTAVTKQQQPSQQ